MKLTEEQKEKLLKAIDLAEGFGACEYVRDGKPRCVIAQFAVLCGVSVGAMEKWRSEGPAAPPLRISEVDVDLGVNRYELQEIQGIWDSAPFEAVTEDVAREKMREVVMSMAR